MGWRTVCITEPTKLELKLGYLVARSEQTTRISLSEIETLIVESTSSALTTALLCELSKRKIKVIFCDEKHNPYAELIDYYGSTDCLRRLKEQLAWSDERCEWVWTEIVREKILRQATLLKEQKQDLAAQMLHQYIEELKPGDSGNREAHAAKVYFNALFDEGFSRQHDSPLNAALNYGYSLLLSSFNKAIVSRGYLTQLGLHHHNTFNPFNFSSDLMEPYRPLVDRFVLSYEFTQFKKEEKHLMLEVLNLKVKIGDTQQLLQQAIDRYCSSVFTALNSQKPQQIEFYQWYDS